MINIKNNSSRNTVILNGLIIDGTNTPPYRGTILIRDGRIAETGWFGTVTDVKSSDWPPDTHVIDASGLCVTPGFIDIHRHCDHAIFKDGFGERELAQGITATVSGQCGLSPFPATPLFGNTLHDFLTPCLGSPVPGVTYDHYAAYADSARSQKIPLLLRSMIGSCAVRIAVKGFGNTPFSPDELKQACRYVAEAMEHGAIGLSMGLMYFPEYYSTRDELTALAKTAARYGGVLAMHIRNEGDSLPESVEEAAQIAEAASVPLEISHLKSCGAHDRRGKLHKSIDIIEHYRRRGVDIHADFYPYTGGATTILSLVPPKYMRDTPAETYAWMATRQGADELESMLRVTHEGWDNYLLALGFDRIIFSSVRHAHNEWIVGKSLQTLLNENPHMSPYRFLSELIADEEGQTGLFVMSMSPEEVNTVAALPWAMVASDALYADTGRPHPRAFGTFPKIIRDFVRERAVLPLHTAIHKMTALPAQKMGFAPDRGVIRPGAYADLCIFDPDSLTDRGDFTTPPGLASGMAYVLREGKIIRQENVSAG